MSLFVLLSYRCHYRRMRVVSLKGEIFILEIEQALYFRIEFHCWEWSRFSRELEVHLLEVIQIDVCVSRSMDELSWFKSAYLGHHHSQKGIGCDIERNAEECVSASLIKLTGKLSVRHIELEKAVARREGHLIDLSRIPCTYEHSPAVRVSLYCIDDFRKLIDRPSVRSRP